MLIRIQLCITKSVNLTLYKGSFVQESVVSFICWYLKFELTSIWLVLIRNTVNQTQNCNMEINVSTLKKNQYVQIFPNTLHTIKSVSIFSVLVFLAGLSYF